MLSRFAAGLAILLGQQVLWSIKIPWYFHRSGQQECYNYQHSDIEKIKIRKANIENIYLTYLSSKVLYINIPNAEAGNISTFQNNIQKKRKTKLRLEIQTEQIFISGDGSEICLKPKEDAEEATE